MRERELSEPIPTFATPEDAIVATVAYTDIFDYPLTAAEIHRYLIGVALNRASVDSILNNGIVPKKLAREAEFYTLPERTGLVEIRRERANIAKGLWKAAHHYGRWVAHLPFVRMVAVTGSLAVNNSDDSADIDYLIITANDRLWLCRLLVVSIVKIAERSGIELCPNYFLAERALTLSNRNLYAARELAQMVPLAGWPMYQQLLAANQWMYRFLPNSLPSTKDDFPMEMMPNRRVSRWMERGLASKIGGKIENWERERKIGRFKQQYTRSDEIDFAPDWCKGHFNAHEQRVLNHYEDAIRKPSN